jgi:hypothetical protein
MRWVESAELAVSAAAVALDIMDLADEGDDRDVKHHIQTTISPPRD